MTFKELNLIEPLLKALSAEGYTSATPIQEQAIPLLLEGRDIMGCAQTGTGKTAAFALPIIQRLTEAHAGKIKIKALVLSPTRELAIQIGESFEAYSQFTNIRHTVVFGGVGQQPQIDAIRRGVQVLVATPGRLLDLCQQGHVSLSQLDYFVLDEADRMLDMGFIHDIRKVLKIIPQKRQTLFFSATMPDEIMRLASSMLHNPSHVEVTPPSTTVEKIEQSVYFIEKQDKRNLLLHLLKNPELESVLVFTRTKHGADNVARFLTKNGQKAEAIHGNKSQTARQKALKGFKDHSLRTLIATDIAARGIDVDHLSHVVNYELPNIPETYVHRIGRTGRAGREGVAISFCASDERPYLRDIQKTIGLRVPVEKLPENFVLRTVNDDVESEEQGASNENEQKRGRNERSPRANRPQREQRKPKADRERSSSPRAKSPAREGDERQRDDRRDSRQRSNSQRNSRNSQRESGNDRRQSRNSQSDSTSSSTDSRNSEHKSNRNSRNSQNRNSEYRRGGTDARRDGQQRGRNRNAAGSRSEERADLHVDHSDSQREVKKKSATSRIFSFFLKK